MNINLKSSNNETLYKRRREFKRNIMKTKKGLYAKYSKQDGSFIETFVSGRFNKNKYQSNKYFTTLITENPNLIYKEDSLNIPKFSKDFDTNMIFESTEGFFECEICFEYFEEKDMYHISDDNSVSECNMCNNL